MKKTLSVFVLSSCLLILSGCEAPEEKTTEVTEESLIKECQDVCEFTNSTEEDLNFCKTNCKKSAKASKEWIEENL